MSRICIPSKFPARVFVSSLFILHVKNKTPSYDVLKVKRLLYETEPVLSPEGRVSAECPLSSCNYKHRAVWNKWYDSSIFHCLQMSLYHSFWDRWNSDVICNQIFKALWSRYSCRKVIFVLPFKYSQRFIKQVIRN